VGGEDEDSEVDTIPETTIETKEEAQVAGRNKHDNPETGTRLEALIIQEVEGKTDGLKIGIGREEEETEAEEATETEATGPTRTQQIIILATTALTPLAPHHLQMVVIFFNLNPQLSRA